MKHSPQNRRLIGFPGTPAKNNGRDPKGFSHDPPALACGSSLIWRKASLPVSLARCLTVLHTLGIKVEFIAPAGDGNRKEFKPVTELDVYLQRDLAGRFRSRRKWARLAFYRRCRGWAIPSWCCCLIHFHSGKKNFSRNECRGFFAGILPEESKREIIAKNLGISPRNDFAMLEQIGGERAGAVIVYPGRSKIAGAEITATVH